MRARLSPSQDAFSRRSSSKSRRLADPSLRDRDRLRRRSISQPSETLLRLLAMAISRTRRISRLPRVVYLSSEEECLQLQLRPMTVRRIATSPPDLPLALAIRITTIPTVAHRIWTARVVPFRPLNKEAMPVRLSSLRDASNSSSSKLRRITDPSPRDRDRLRRRSISQPTVLPLRLRATTIFRTRPTTRLQSTLLVSNAECLHLRLRPTTIPRTATRTPSLLLQTAIRTPTSPTRVHRLVPFRLRELERLALQEWADQQRRTQTGLTRLRRQTPTKPSTLAAPLLPVPTRATSTLRRARHRETAQARSERSRRTVTTRTSRRTQLSILVQLRVLR